jgi:hypothetical protein
VILGLKQLQSIQPTTPLGPVTLFLAEGSETIVQLNPMHIKETAESVWQWYEQTKRAFLQLCKDKGIADDNEPFVLACRLCGMTYPRVAEIGMVAQHFQLEHEEHTGPIPMDLIYLGAGLPPAID